MSSVFMLKEVGSQPTAPVAQAPLDGVVSILDTDLYKLTMQKCVLRYFPNVRTEHKFYNRTPTQRLNAEAFAWLDSRIKGLEQLSLTKDELAFLQKHCSFLGNSYLDFLSNFRFRPQRDVEVTFTPDADGFGDLAITVRGLWIDTILYEIPLLALTSEAYFRFVVKDWSHNGQTVQAEAKADRLLRGNCVFSEFGTRRRRDHHTQDLVMQGILNAVRKVAVDPVDPPARGRFVGTSNLYFAMKYEVPPIGTVAHEWIMGVAAITDDYEQANQLALRCWANVYGTKTLSTALTDTFGTRAFLPAFGQKVGAVMVPSESAIKSCKDQAGVDRLRELYAYISNDCSHADVVADAAKTFADAFIGVRQDSGDPCEFADLVAGYYRRVLPGGPAKAVVFSDSLNVDKCLRYRAHAEPLNLAPSFGIGTDLTNDFVNTDGQRSKPMNIVIKLASADGRPAIKISDDAGKNTGDAACLASVKRLIAHQDRVWADESARWQ